MIEFSSNGRKYKLPISQNIFQRDMYIHLIDYKWNTLNIKDAGLYYYKKQAIEYDAIIPESVRKDFPLIYKPIRSVLNEHRKPFPFKLHLHFNHMASSQAANANLFIPILIHNKVNEVLSQLKNDFDRLDRAKLFKGFQIEYWDGKGNGVLGDHNARSGTDSDIAIAYYNKNNESCLWLIEHKLTEKEFTECGGFKSSNRNKNEQRCESSFSEILKNPSLCYYNKIRKTNYWKITTDNIEFFANHSFYKSCPFKGGMNQLWRNQLLGLALEKAKAYDHVFFSVIKHPDNKALDKSINYYKMLINNDSRFSVLNSSDVVKAANKLNDETLNNWVKWYCDLYKIDY